MLKCSFIKEEKKEICIRLKKKNFYNFFIINFILKNEKQKKKIKFKINNLFFYINFFSKKILLFLKNKYFLELIKSYSFFLKKKRKSYKKIIKKINIKLINNLIKIPNIPSKEIKKKTNIVLYQNFDKKKIKQNLLTHWELGKKFKLFCLKQGSIISGNGFNVLINTGALYQRSLIQFFLEKNIISGYIEYILPFIVNKNSVYGTGQFPDKENQMYNINYDNLNLYLIPTGEVPLINIFKNKIFKESELPLKGTTNTSCFRRESGSYGTNVRGLNRLHQFDKVEIVQISTCYYSYYSFYEMVNHIKYILLSLKLKFRIIQLCGNELGFTSALTYDFEVYSPGQKKWLEVSSVSNCINFQSNRLNIKYRSIKGNIQDCHSLNGSSLAIPRIFSTLIENYQNRNYILIPKELIKLIKIKKINICQNIVK
ncbi:serine--tRNA ligase [Candidatus Karelsulcia muelleri]|uniref:serine--tRNA ligase n=1 Tax=Candidatus Karelsulcia muelleri TaxID=336810 RepID=UPI000D7BE2B2|nr:serine--tRNA ligase [Candidatus Karelsulcia muelleri]